MTLRLYFGSKICLPTERNKEQKERRSRFSGVQQQDKGQWAQIETQEVLSEYEKKLLDCEGGRVLEQLSRESVSLLLWGYSNPPGHHPVPPGPAVAEGLDWMISRGPFQSHLRLKPLPSTQKQGGALSLSCGCAASLLRELLPWWHKAGARQRQPGCFCCPQRTIQAGPGQICHSHTTAFPKLVVSQGLWVLNNWKILA